MPQDPLVQVRAYLLAKPGTSEGTPFGPDYLVFKVLHKMFAGVAWEGRPAHLSLKCDPDHALLLRAIYPTVTAGYHLNKRHWNTVALDGSVPWDELAAMMDESYDLVVAGMTRAARAELAALAQG
ncbi:MAG: MmcQ/YjbR family DNA-binding protein [Chloroflexi bacterium]|nr:MmcQ/YjbR family DNA-binding protein [Chloroflexota bacterium]